MQRAPPFFVRLLGATSILNPQLTTNRRKDHKEFKPVRTDLRETGRYSGNHLQPVVIIFISLLLPAAQHPLVPDPYGYFAAVKILQQRNHELARQAGQLAEL